MTRRRLACLLTLGVLAAIAWLIASVPRVTAAPAAEDAKLPAKQTVGNDVCLGCHSNPSLSVKLANGDELSLFINVNDHAKSAHGQAGIVCVQCHTNIKAFPHPAFSAADRRDASLQLYTICQACHADQYQKADDSVHSRALAGGNRQAAICTDCHTAHTVRRLTDPTTNQLLPNARIWIPETCSKCHSAIYDEYRASVHGNALTQENNLDVPTCIDCHGVHNIEDPTTAGFRLKSPSLCARCHTNPEIMDKYGISTQVLNTYVADFHGTTVTLFTKLSPDAETNKPVCFDCHGVHDIQRVDDPEKGLQVRENLLKRCQVCHPSATANFSAAWLSHYIPSQDKAPLVFFVNQFYQIFIPGVLGGMAVLVVLDISSVVRARLRKRKVKPRPQRVPDATPAGGVPAAPVDPDQSSAGKESSDG